MANISHLKLLQLASPKQTKNTLNLLIDLYNNLDTDVREIADASKTNSENAVNTANTAASKVDNAIKEIADYKTATETRVDSFQEDMNTAKLDITNLKTTTKEQAFDITSNTNNIASANTKINNHIANKSNPHSVTKSQIGLGNVDNTSDSQKPVSTAQANAINTVQTNLDNFINTTNNNFNKCLLKSGGSLNNGAGLKMHITDPNTNDMYDAFYESVYLQLIKNAGSDNVKAIKIRANSIEYTDNITTSYTYSFPTKSGTFALTTDVTDILSNKTVVKNINISTSGDNVSISETKTNLGTDTETTETNNIPLANDTTGGLMSSADYKQIRQNTSRIEQLEGQTTRLLYTASENPTASDINTFVTGLGYTSPFNGIAVVVDNTYHIWHYYENDNIGWRDDGADTVNQFTNTNLGTIKGTATDGKVYAETDGTGSVYGWDNLKSTVSDINSNLQNKANYSDIPTKTSELENDSNFATTSNLNNYLPKSGGTMNGDIEYSYVDNANYRHTSKLNSNGLHVEYLPDMAPSPSEMYIRTYGADSIEDFQGNELYFPKKSGTIATTDDIPTNNNQLTNGAEYINKDVNNLTNYTLATNTASSIEMSIDNSTYVVSLKLKNAEGTQLGETQTIDLPLESVVVNGAYDSTTKEIVLTLDNGSEIRFSVADLVSGLATTSDLANYLPLSGGILTGEVTLPNKTNSSNTAHRAYIDAYLNIQHGVEDTNDSFNISKYNGNATFKVNYETGRSTLFGDLTVTSSTPGDWCEGIYIQNAGNGWSVLGLGNADKTNLIGLTHNIAQNMYTISRVFNGAQYDIQIPTKSGTFALEESTLQRTTGIQAVWSGTQSEYDAITTKDATTLYFIKEE